MFGRPLSGRPVGGRPLGGRRLGFGDGTAPTGKGVGAPAFSLPVLPVTPSARYSAQFSTVTESSGKVTNWSDIMALADAQDRVGSIGPVRMTDGAGKKFMRFDGTAYLTIGTALTFAHTRSVTVFAVARNHRTTFNAYVLSGGSVADATAGNSATLHTLRQANVGEAPFVGNARAAASNREHMIVGQQLAVYGNLRRVTGSGGDVCYVNRKECVVGVQSNGTALVNGAEIGRYAFGPGSSGNWAQMDLYELVVYNTSLTPAQCQAIQAALADAYGIVEVDNQLVLEGDSITSGLGVLSHQNASMVLTEPGSSWVPANYRVVNMGVSGSKVADLVTRRDVSLAPLSFLLSGKNICAFEIGINDVGTLTAQQIYDAIVAYIYATTTGLLQRGWTVRELANIMAGGSANVTVDPLRLKLHNSQMLLDVHSGAGDTYDGKFSVLSTDLIAVAGQTIFESTADTANTTYYQADGVHPVAAGAAARATGADTPQYGIAYGLTA